MFLARRQAQQLTTQLLRKVFARLVYIARNYYYLCNSPGTHTNNNNTTTTTSTIGKSTTTNHTQQFSYFLVGFLALSLCSSCACCVLPSERQVELPWTDLEADAIAFPQGASSTTTTTTTRQPIDRKWNFELNIVQLPRAMRRNA